MKRFVQQHENVKIIQVLNNINTIRRFRKKHFELEYIFVHNQKQKMLVYTEIEN